jgi:hypothetical protein
MPVADLFVSASAQMAAALPSIESRYQDRKNNRFSQEDGKDGETDAVKELARASSFVLPLVVASTSAAGWAQVHGRFSAYSWFSPFDLSGAGRKNGGHEVLCGNEITLTQAWTHRVSKGMAQFSTEEGLAAGSWALLRFFVVHFWRA